MNPAITSKDIIKLKFRLSKYLNKSEEIIFSLNRPSRAGDNTRIK